MDIRSCAVSGYRDVEVVRCPEAPERRCRTMGEHCTGPCGKYRGDPAAISCQHLVPDRVDPAVKRAQAPVLQSVPDGIVAHASMQELASRDHAVLAVGNLR